MRVYSKTSARHRFAEWYNLVRYAGSIVGFGKASNRVEGKIFPEILAVRMPTPKDIEKLKKDPRGFNEALKAWLLDKLVSELDDTVEVL